MMLQINMRELKRTSEIDEVDHFISHLYGYVLNTSDSIRLRVLNDLRRVVSFDGAIWASGPQYWKFHEVTQIGLPDEFSCALEQMLQMNPMAQHMLSDRGVPTDMCSVMPDMFFFHSEIYARCFERYGISRIVRHTHFDSSSGTYSLLALFRRDQNSLFSEQDRQTLKRATVHLFNTDSHAFSLHLMQKRTAHPAESAGAVIDREGFIQEVQPRFSEILEKYFPDCEPNVLPFSLPAERNTKVINGLCIRHEPLPGFSCVLIWPARVLDLLTQRERAILNAVAHGLSFKETAHRMNSKTSSVANGFYRIYAKLGVNSRSQLLGLVSSRA